MARTFLILLLVPRSLGWAINALTADADNPRTSTRQEILPVFMNTVLGITVLPVYYLRFRRSADANLRSWHASDDACQKFY